MDAGIEKGESVGVDTGRAGLRGTLGWVWTVFGPFLGLVLVSLLFAFLTRDSGSFLSVYNWRTIAVQTVIVGTAALGMTIIIISGGIDLSVGSIVALVTVVTALLVRDLDPPTTAGGPNDTPSEFIGSYPFALTCNKKNGRAAPPAAGLIPQHTFSRLVGLLYSCAFPSHSSGKCPPPSATDLALYGLLYTMSPDPCRLVRQVKEF